MKKLLLFLATTVVLAQTLRATTYYVSKSGSDSNGGTSTNAAFLTISKAGSVMTNGDTCFILSGTYRENVTPAHSGSSGSPITFAAYAGATPIVSGADVLTNTWSVYTNSIYECTTTNIVNQLFLDSYMMNIARWPNANVDQLLYAPRSTPTSVSLTNVTDLNLPSGLSLAGAYVHFFDSESGNQGYAASTRPITGWNSATKTFSWATNVYRADSSGCLYYVYGALSLLDIPTEWYQTNTTLYLWAPNSDSPGNHTVETKNRTNAFTLDNLSYVMLSNIYVFAAGISMAHTTNCVVNGCNLIYVQHDMTADYTRDVHIANQVSGTGSQWINSVIDYSSQDGIRLLGTNEVVSNCVVYNVDYYPGTYYSCVSPNSTSAGGITVINNTLWYSGRYCIGDSSDGNNNICSNDLAYGELLTSDGGSSYMYGHGANGTTIHHNWAHNSWAGCYLDMGQSGFVVYCNVCYSNHVGLQFNGFSNNLIINNTSVSNTSEDIVFNGTGDVNVQLYNNLWNATSITADAGTTQTDDGWFPPINTNYIPMTGSGAINGGLIDAPYTDGYVGTDPDIGAFVGGSNTYWTPGAKFVAALFPRSMLITMQPSNQTDYLTQTATFSVLAEAPTAVTYQWQVESNGSYVNLSASGQYSGVTSTNLTISSLALTNATNYEVVATASSVSVTSIVAALTVTNLNYQAAVLFDGAVAYWPMQETNGPTVYDIVSTNNGTLVTSTDNNIGLGYHTNFVTAGTGATDGKTYLFGGAGGLTGVSGDTAIYFTNLTASASNSQIVIPYNSALDPSNALTAEAWIKVPTYPIGYTNTAFQVPLGLEANATVQNGWWMGLKTDSSGSEGDFEFNLAKAPGAGWTTSTSTASLSGAWVYAVEVYTGSNTNLSCYTNGVLMASVTATAKYESEGLYSLHELPFIIGSYCVSYSGGGTMANGFERGDFWHGAIAHVAIYTNVLTASQITNHYYYGTNLGFPPSIITQPSSTTNYTTQTSTFGVSASGIAPLAYQWKVQSSGSYVNLSNGGQYSGVTNTTLSISSLALTNATNYEVVVTNSFGSVTSPAAALTVSNAVPSITTQPANQTKNGGQTATFSMTAIGMPTLSYQWLVASNGSYVNLANAGQFSGVTTSTLSISSLALTNATNYEVVVTNSAGSVTSSAATLTITWYQTVILGDAPVSYWPMQETTGPAIKDIVTTNAGPFNGTMQVSTDGFTNGGTDGQGKVWGIIHETFTNVTSTAATDGATYLFGGSGGLAGVSGDKAVYFTNLNGKLNSAQIAMGTNGTGVYEAQLDSLNFSVEAWLKVPTYTIGWSSNAYQIPLGLNAYGNSGNTANGWFMGVKTDSSGSGAYGELFFDAGTGTAFASNGPSAQVFSGQWVYAVQEYNGTATVIYTNGTLMVSNAQTYKPLTNGPTHEMPFIIGSENAYYFGGSTFSGNTRADFWHGGISHVAYYNYALSASKITNHYYYGTNASFGLGGAPHTPVQPTYKPTVEPTPIVATLTPAVLPMSQASQFQMQVTAVANQNYTLQMSTDLSSGNWVSLYTTNSTTNTSFVMTDPDAATNKQRFYRVLIGP